MCMAEGIKLNPAKVRVGGRQGKFYGFVVNEQGMAPTKSNLDPVAKMTAPVNVSGVRSILGIFVQFRHFFKRYDRLVKPIQALLKKGTQFKWTEE